MRSPVIQRSGALRVGQRLPLGFQDLNLAVSDVCDHLLQYQLVLRLKSFLVGIGVLRNLLRSLGQVRLVRLLGVQDVKHHLVLVVGVTV